MHAQHNRTSLLSGVRAGVGGEGLREGVWVGGEGKDQFQGGFKVGMRVRVGIWGGGECSSAGMDVKRLLRC